jgi:hypothetical protein
MSKNKISNKDHSGATVDTTNIKLIKNPSGFSNPSGGVLAARRFGGGGQGFRKFSGGLSLNKSNSIKSNNQSKAQFEDDNMSEIDDNMSTGDVMIIKGNSSEFGGD